MTKEPFNFSLELEEEHVTIADEKYVLVELTGTQRDKYLNGLGARMKVEPGSKPGTAPQLRNFDGLQASLVAMALRKLGDDGTRGPVAQNTIQAWPAKTVSALHDIAKRLSGLDDDDEKKDTGSEDGNDTTKEDTGGND